MATETTTIEQSFFEKIGEKWSAFSDGFARLLTRVVGSSNERAIKGVGFIPSRDPAKPHTIIPGSLIARINDLEPKMAALTASELKEQTALFRKRLADGATLDDLLPEAFAACREAGKRAKNMRHYDVQIIGGIFLHRGCIAEMMTGEGKTLVATLAAYLNALTSEGVHIVTVNDYLARRDCEWMLPIYQMLGITAGYIQSDQDPDARRRAYECDITYGTNSEFGFDYLRDNMKPARWDDTRYNPYYRQVQRKLNYAIIDEVDNILIDEARTPLIISGPAFSDVRLYEEADRVARALTEMENKARAELAAAGTPIDAPLKPGEKKREMGVYFEVKEKDRTVHLTDRGVREAERLAGVDSFYTAGNMEWPHLIDNALKAHHLYHLDRNYMIAMHEGERKIIIIDEFTGRAMFGRQWSDGLHQAVEAKHKRDGVKIKQENQTMATITLQNFFKLYKKLSGMTGTAMTEANEFWKVYKLDVIAIPTNKVTQRINYPDLVYRTEREKYDAVLKDIMEVHATGRPILIGTTDVAKSEHLSQMLKRKGIKHELLNAKPENVARESEIVAQAGRRGAVTIATNMAGRGTDIILGGNPEYMAWNQLKNSYPTRLDVPDDIWKQTVDAIEAREKTKEAGREIAALGGLHIIGTERHESRRIDNQLRGRAGRQGDPGSSRFYLSLQDHLMRLFAGEWVSAVLTRLGMKEGEAIESRLVTKRIEAAQKKVEESNFEIRKNLLEYDEVMDVQRKGVYGKRQEILNDANPRAMIFQMIEEQIAQAVERYLNPHYGSESFADFASNRLGIDFEEGEFRNLSYPDAAATAKEKAIRFIPTVIQEGIDENLSLDEDPENWSWAEMARIVNTRYALKLNERELKRIGRDDLAEFLLREATRYVEQIDLSEGRRYLEPEWGVLSLCDWASNKFRIEMSISEIQPDTPLEKVQEILSRKVREAYHRKDQEFPVQVAMTTFMAERASGPGAVAQKYNREGLYIWAMNRYPQAVETLGKDFFLTESRNMIRETLMDISRREHQELDHELISEKVEQALSGTTRAELDDARELVDWFNSQAKTALSPDLLVGQDANRIKNILWNAYDDRYRPEMHRMERGLLLEIIDVSWKNHLLVMDHLRSAVSLRSFAQEDPKIVYKKEGMKRFAEMWESIADRVTDTVFRMEEAPEEVMQDVLWAGARASQERALGLAEAARLAAQQNQAAATNNQQLSTNSTEAVRAEPIRKHGLKIGRNDPCHCGSGKKYKNCHMNIDQAQK